MSFFISDSNKFVTTIEVVPPAGNGPQALLDNWPVSPIWILTGSVWPHPDHGHGIPCEQQAEPI